MSKDSERQRSSEPANCEQCGEPFFPFAASKARFCNRICTSQWTKEHPKTLQQKFTEKIEKLPSGCWSIGSGGKKAYPKISHDGKQLHGHRLAWEFFRGPIPDGLFVCHNCPGGDNRWCVNPNHLFLGTNAENIKDGNTKRGHAPGGNRKLTPEQVVQIKRELSEKRPRKDIALSFKVSHVTIEKIAGGRSWSWVQSASS